MIRSLLRKLFHLEKRIDIHCDKAELLSDTLEVSGWAIADEGIKSIELSIDGFFIGNAEYGYYTPVVEQSLSYVTHSAYSGFYYKSNVAKLKKPDSDEYEIVIKARTKTGTIREVVVPVINQSYQTWIEHNEPDEEELERQRQTRFPYEPTISIVTPTFNTPKQFLTAMIESVLAQTYSHWELCIADGGSDNSHVKEVLQCWVKKDNRLKIKFLPQNEGIAGNTNAAFSLATGDFIALLDHDDLLAPFAFFEVIKTINEYSEVNFIYSDEDKLSEDGRVRSGPHFKPDWSFDTLRGYNYILHLTIFRKKLLDRIGGFREGYEGSQDFDLFLRVVEQTKHIVHIPKVLYHWRKHAGSIARGPRAKLYAYESAKRALREHLERLGKKGRVEDGLFLSSYQIIYEMRDTPKISILIHTKDQTDDLHRCVRTILDTSSYRHFEILIIDNGSVDNNTSARYEGLKTNNSIRILRYEHSVNDAVMNNFAIHHAQGDVVLFLHHDVEVINADWLERMLEYVIREDVGAVGAKLYYPDHTLQHAGMILGIKGVAGYSQRNFPRDSGGYAWRLKLLQNVSAVTAACLMIRKRIFEAVGGFDEKYVYAYHDVDLCLKLREKGYMIVWTPYAELYHYEPKNKGLNTASESQERVQKDIALFQTRWKEILKQGDPYYSPHLTLEREDFSLNIRKKI